MNLPNRQTDKVTKSYEGVLNPSAELYQLAEKIMSQGAQLDRRIPFHAILAYFGVRAARIHWAIVQLCRDGNGPEALILLRSFLNLLIDLLYIHADRDTRSQRYLRYGELMRGEAWKIYKRWHIEGPFQRLRGEEEQRQVDQRDQELAEYPLLLKKEFSRRKFGWADCPIRKRASSVQLEYEYDSVYRLGSAMDHIAPSGTRYFMRETDDGFQGVLSPQFELVPQVLVSSCDYLRKVMKLWSTEFHAEGHDELRKWGQKADQSFSTAMDVEAR